MWAALVNDVLSQIERWTLEEDWQVARMKSEAPAASDPDAEYLPDLRIRTNSGILDVKVRHFDDTRTSGYVDLVAYPGGEQFTLSRPGNRWIVKAFVPYPGPTKWGKATFAAIARVLTRPWRAATIAQEDPR
jgi:hypothetical protein